MSTNETVYNVQIIPYDSEILGNDPLIRTYSTYDKANDYFEQILSIYEQKYTYRSFEKLTAEHDQPKRIVFFQKPEESTENDNIVMLLTLLPMEVE